MKPMLTRGILAAAAAILVLAQAMAQDRTLRLVVPFPPGGGIDVVARLLAPKLQAQLGQNAIVDNKPGGSGFVGTLTVVKAKPDGQHLLIQALGMSMNPSIYKNLPYDPVKDIEPVGLIGVIPVTLAVGNHVPARTLEEFISLARKQPGKYKGAAFVTGSATVMLEMFKQQAGVDIDIVNYRGTSLALAATVNGETDFVIMPSAVSFIKEGRIRGLAVAADRRMEELPELPTTAEAGLPNFKIEFWFAAFTTAGTPASRIDTLNTELNNAVATPDVSAKLRSMGIEPRTGSAAQFREQHHREMREWADVVKKAGFQPLEAN